MAFQAKSKAERLAHVYEGATIYYHRILYSRQRQLVHQYTERGDTRWDLVDLAAAQDAVDGWDDQVLDADNHQLPVPTAETESERRLKIAAIVDTFPTELIREIASLSFADNPELIKKNWQLLSGASSNLSTPVPASSLPAPTVEDSAQKMPSVFPATTQG
jgi:hypothetical protein